MDNIHKHNDGKGPVKLYERIERLEQENAELAAELHVAESRNEMPHHMKLLNDVQNSTSPALIQAIAMGHLITAIRETNTGVDLFQMIVDFHVKYKLEYNGDPRQLPKKLLKFRTDFLQEELDEYRKGIAEGDLEQQFDALMDLIYVALGNAYLQGFDFNEGFKRVHGANMKKVRAATAMDSKRGSNQDVVKPKGWKPPYLKDLV